MPRVINKGGGNYADLVKQDKEAFAARQGGMRAGPGAGGATAPPQLAGKPAGAGGVSGQFGGVMSPPPPGTMPNKPDPGKPQVMPPTPGGSKPFGGAGGDINDALAATTAQLGGPSVAEALKRRRVLGGPLGTGGSLGNTPGGALAGSMATMRPQVPMSTPGGAQDVMPQMPNVATSYGGVRDGVMRLDGSPGMVTDTFTMPGGGQSPSGGILNLDPTLQPQFQPGGVGAIQDLVPQTPNVPGGASAPAPFVGRGGNAQASGGGQFGGAPPPDVLARRQALANRQRQLVAAQGQM